MEGEDRLRPLLDADDLVGTEGRLRAALDAEDTDAGRAEVMTQLARVELWHGWPDAARELLDDAGRLAGDVPVVRARLLRMGPEDFRLMVTAHRAVADDTAMDRLVLELVTLYRALSNAEPPRLEGGPSAHSEVAAAQRAYAATHEGVDALRRLKSRLTGAPALVLPVEVAPPVGHPADRPRGGSSGAAADSRCQAAAAPPPAARPSPSGSGLSPPLGAADNSFVQF